MQKLEEIEFDPNDVLGDGGYGTVVSGMYKGQKVAVKIVRLINTNESEEHILKQLDHPNIVKLFHVEKDSKDKHFALELCDASMNQLFLDEKHAKKYRGPKLPPRFTVLLQLASGLEHIHSLKLIHRDIKPENVLIHVDSDEKVTMKWADFGLSKPVNERGTYTQTKIRGTMDWMAPELLKQLDDEEEKGISPGIKRRGTVKSDVFAQGLAFGYFMSDGKHLFGIGRKIEPNISKNRPVNLASVKSSRARELLLKMLMSDPSERTTSQEVVEQLQLIIKEVKQMEKRLFELLGAPNVDLQEVNSLIDEGVDVNCVNEKGLTPFLHLVRECNTKINLMETVRLLIDNNVDVNSKDSDGWNALHFLCRFYGNENLIDIIQLLIQNGIVVDSKDGKMQNPLHVLCEHYKKDNLTDIIGVLIDNGIDVNSKKCGEWKAGWNALHISCKNFQKENLIDVVRLLIEKGIDLNCKTKDYEENALHVLCRYYRYNNWIDIIRLLIQSGIDVHARNHQGFTALHSLCKSYNKEVNLIDEIKFFFELGFDVNSKTEDEWNALHILSQNYENTNLIDIVHFFIEKGMDLNHANKDGWNALHILCQNYKNENSIDIVQLFIEKGVDVNCANEGGWNALHNLCQNYKNENLIDIVRILIQNGIDVNWKNKAGWNALLFLCKNYVNDNLIKIVQLLIEHGININHTTKEGNALHLLCKYYPNENLVNVLQLLISNGITANRNGVVERIRKNPNQANNESVVQFLDKHFECPDGM